MVFHVMRTFNFMVALRELFIYWVLRAEDLRAFFSCMHGTPLYEKCYFFLCIKVFVLTLQHIL